MSHPIPSMRVQSVCHIEFEYLLSYRIHFFLTCFRGSSTTMPISFRTLCMRL